jgi:hypothetical protein
LPQPATTPKPRAEVTAKMVKYCELPQLIASNIVGASNFNGDSV